MSNEQKIIQSVDQTVQKAPSEPVTDAGNASSTVNPLGILMVMVGGVGAIPPWWSRGRDEYLRNLVTKSDHLSGALYNFSIKLRTIPLRIRAKNESIKSHVKLAETYENEIKMLSEFGQGFDTLFSKWIDDYHTQDNGAFIEIIADGPKDKAIQGRVLSMAHLDSANCTRTRNPVYPVIYTDPESNKSYKLHHTRVVRSSQRPSPKWNMNDVGFCTVSSIVNTVLSLIDVITYKQEMVGSKPTDKFIVTGGGLDPEDVKTAIALANAQDMNAHRSKYSSLIITGNRNIQDPKFMVEQINKLPEWFDEKEATILAMSVIAMNFGMDARELFPGMEGGATKADAIISHIKQRGKGPGHVLTTFENILNIYYLPQYLKAEFDYQDDSEDRQRAEIRNIRAQGRSRDLETSVTNKRVERQKMLHEGEITQSMFEDLELEVGRLPDGVDVAILFESDDSDYTEWLGNVNESNWEEGVRVVSKFLINSRDEAKIIKARRALAAIKFRFDPPLPENQNGDTVNNEIDDSYEDERAGRKLPRTVTTAVDETQEFQEE